MKRALGKMVLMTFRDNDGHGRLATGDVPGDVAVIRLDIPQGLEQEVRLLMEGAAGAFSGRSQPRAGAANLAK